MKYCIYGSDHGKFFVIRVFKLRFIMWLILCIFIAFLNVGCSSTKEVSNENNSQELFKQYLQQSANKFLKDNTKQTHLSAVSITAGCPTFLYSSVYAGTYAFGGNTYIDQNSEFQVGSITKSFISVVILQLAAESKYKFNLDDKLSKWLPEYTNWGSVTIRQLLNMTSGIPNYVTKEFEQQFSNNEYQYYSPKMVLKLIKNKPLEFNPGSKYDYSNSNYILLGEIINKVSGKTPKEEIEARIIIPLKLKHTFYVENLQAQVINSKYIVSGYRLHSGTIRSFDDIKMVTMSIFAGNANIVSTTADISVFINALFNSKKLLNQTQFMQLTSLVSVKNAKAIKELKSDNELGYGLGVKAIIYNKHMYYIYSCNTLGFVLKYLYNPSNHSVVIMATNAYDGYAIKGYWGSNITERIDNINFAIMSKLAPHC